MKVCIFGSRGFTNRPALDRAMAAAAETGIVPTVVLSGREPTGADRLGEQWAADHGLPVVPYPADWSNLTTPGAVVRRGRFGPYNARAGPDRNARMAAAADAGVCCWDGVSPGTRGMIELLRKLGKPVHVELVGGDRVAGTGAG